MKTSKILQARWVILLALMLLFGVYVRFETTWNPWISALAAASAAILVTFTLETWLRLFLQRTPQEESAVISKKNDEAASPTNKTLNSLRRLLQVHSEKDILDEVMQVGIDLMSARGASFVPYDEWGQSLPALIHGKVPGPALQRLSLPETRQKCKNCESYHGSDGCVLLSITSGLQSSVHCFPLNSSGREVGVFNFYFSEEAPKDFDAGGYFPDILEAAGQAIENMHSRDQEIAALHYLQTISSPKSDLSVLLNDLLENIQRALDVDFVMLYLPAGIPGKLNPNPSLYSRTKGNTLGAQSIPDLPFLEGIWKSVLTSGHSLSLENVVQHKHENWKSLLAVPLAWQREEPAGVLVLGSNSLQAFTARHQALLETLAGQAALLVQNARLMVQVEYQAVVDERTRLAREIHDGLAQTLAFLKIQAAQMQNFLERGETEKLTNTLQANYRTLSDAYIDARQAIDNLRRAPSTDLREWIGNVAADYEQTTGQKVVVSVDAFPVEYPVNVQAQMIRIVQEALSNVRKHASATSVSVTGIRSDDSYQIIVHDNGKGFSPLDGKNEADSHYGLKGMRERSEIIGADFQITSNPGRGTSVSLRVPAIIKEGL
jgi:two-component system nitrate/nitrite sensor histidine kinase NarX